MKTLLHNEKGEKVGEESLPEEIFKVKVSPDLVHQVMVAQMANKRQGTAHTKDRGEVSGGGRKPWAQKGTGRARHGSIRSPIWIGGGVAFGPRKERNFKKDIPKKMRRKALLMVLSSKAENGYLILLDNLNLDKISTKKMVEILNKQEYKEEGSQDPKKKKRVRSCLIVLPKKSDIIYKSARNIPKTKVIEARNLNVLDLLSHKYLVMPKESLKVIKETFVKN